MPDLTMPKIADSKVYEDQPVVELDSDENGLFGTKTMKWALVPERDGQIKIPFLAVSFFDPHMGQYKTIKTPPAFLEVIPGDKASAAVSPGLRDQNGRSTAKQEVKTIGHDILPIHSSVRNLATGTGPGVEGWASWALFFAPPCLFGLVFCGTRLQRKTEADRAYLKSKKAAKACMHACRHDGQRPNDVILAVRTYLNDRLGLSLGSLTPLEAFDILTSRGVATEAAKGLQEILQKLESAIYTGEGEKACGVGKEMAHIIKRIDKKIR